MEQVEQQESASLERRAGKRHSAVLLLGKLCGDRPGVCLVHNISATGAESGVAYALSAIITQAQRRPSIYDDLHEGNVGQPIRIICSDYQRDTDGRLASSGP